MARKKKTEQIDEDLILNPEMDEELSNGLGDDEDEEEEE